MTARSLAVVAGIGALAAPAVAGPTYFATKGKNLFRVSDSGVETFKLDHKLNSMSFDADGRLWGTTQKDDDGDGSYELVEIVNPFGAGLASQSRGDFIGGQTGSIFFKSPELLGFDKTNDQLLMLDGASNLTDPMGPLLGDTGGTIGSSAYDAATNSLYAIKQGTLFNVTDNAGSYQLNEIAQLSGGVSGKIGGEWFDGQYYHSVNDGETFHVYTVNLETGALTEVITWDVQGRGPNGFAVGVVPAPGTAALLGLGAALSVRRRRR